MHAQQSSQMPGTVTRAGAEGLLPGTFLALLEQTERDALCGLGVRRSFRKGAILMLERDLDGRVMLVVSGRVKITSTDEDGRETLLSLRDPGDVLGELSFVDRRPHSATVTALEPVEAVIVPDSVFRSHLESTPRVAVVLLEAIAGRLRESTVKRSQFGASDTMGRLAARIMELADRYGEDTDRGIAVVSPLSQEELASWTGASRAGVGQALQSMRELGWLETDRRTLVVRDPDALRGRAA
jgi:CRP/FNR family cyclic AMP-dependent transcriptional regulator